jgi:tetratricopeptide (TPR) repeat protein
MTHDWAARLCDGRHDAAEGYRLAKSVANLFESAPSDAADAIYRFVHDHEQVSDDLASELDNALGALEWVQSEAQNHLVAGLTSLLNEFLRSHGYWQELRYALEQAVRAACELGYQVDEATLSNNLGVVYADLGEWRLALDAHRHVLAIKEQLGDAAGLAATYANLGNLYLQQGNWTEALACYQKDLVLSEALGDELSLAATYNNLGSLYLQRGEWDQAIEFYQKDLVISKRLGDTRGVAETTGNLAAVHLRKGDLNQALALYQQVHDTFERLADPGRVAQTDLNLGVVYRRQANWQQALASYRRAQTVFEQLGDGRSAPASGRLGHSTRAISTVYRSEIAPG